MTENLPIIRLEVGHLRHTMVRMMTDHTAKMDFQIKQAIEQACSPDNVQRILDEAARRYLAQAIDDEVKSFLLCGKGRALLRKQIEKRLKQEL